MIYDLGVERRPALDVDFNSGSLGRGSHTVTLFVTGPGQLKARICQTFNCARIVYHAVAFILTVIVSCMSFPRNILGPLEN
jgi:hypothetical protein